MPSIGEVCIVVERLWSLIVMCIIMESANRDANLCASSGGEQSVIWTEFDSLVRFYWIDVTTPNCEYLYVFVLYQTYGLELIMIDIASWSLTRYGQIHSLLAIPIVRILYNLYHHSYHKKVFYTEWTERLLTSREITVSLGIITAKRSGTSSDLTYDPIVSNQIDCLVYPWSVNKPSTLYSIPEIES